MEPDQICPACGHAIPAGEPDCPRCRRNLFLRPDAILLLTLAGLLALFIVTGFAVRMYHAKYAALGLEWYNRGQADLGAGRVEQAVVDFRTALVYGRDQDLYDLRLAQALDAAGRTEEAKAYLTSLWERDPGNAQVNLELGRLAARAGNTEEALRYYHSAMYDDWGSRDPAEARRTVRLELYRFLMRQGDRAQAQSELVAMAALLPPDPALYTQVGRLFMEVDDYARAASEFEDALKLDRNAGEAAVAGAGEAEFHLGNYGLARYDLERALREKPDDARTKELRDLLDEASLVLGADPFDSRLSLVERNRRAIEAFDQAVRRLAACGVPIGKTAPSGGPAPGAPAPASPRLAELADRARALQPEVEAGTLRGNPDLVTKIMNVVFDVEQTPAESCGPPEPFDRALVLLAARRGSAEK
ncbi:MAG TPA: tetratricopeptide repeat protein [Terriglobia bacterium]|jgi:tetratricopeptide (TPR) repeat protein|nr:tetratricopeptide repeat protein [Terriglobia bacterium]